jgi:hypothetical protein
MERDICAIYLREFPSKKGHLVQNGNRIRKVMAYLFWQTVQLISARKKEREIKKEDG